MRNITKRYAVACLLAFCAAVAVSGKAEAAQLVDRTLVVEGGPADDALALRPATLSAYRGRFDRIRVVGGDGFDALTVEGTDAADRFSLSVRNGRLLLDRDPGHLRVRLEGVERLDLAAKGGADRLDVEDLTGAGDLEEVHPDLAAAGGETGDGSVDRVSIEGTDDQEQILLLGSQTDMFVLGTPVFVQVEHAERSDRLRVDGRGGDDLVGGTTAVMAQTLVGGDGADSVIGGPGDDVLIGADGFDDVSGSKGDDVAYMGGAADRFTWQPGDGSDVVEGGAGQDSMFFSGNDLAERFDISAAGRRVRFTRDVDSVAMDLGDVEELDTMALRGADTITVDDLRRTGVDLVGVNLAPSFGTADPDGAADRVVVTGTPRRDSIAVTGVGRAVDVAGLAAAIGITHAEPLDTLAVRGGGGNDSVDSSGLPPDTIGLALE
jgi:Ca2+-binding RTX toxin-like protein